MDVDLIMFGVGMDRFSAYKSYAQVIKRGPKKMLKRGFQCSLAALHWALVGGDQMPSADKNWL